MSIVTTSATPTAVIRETTTWERFPTLWGELLGEVWTYLRTADVQTGRNVMVYPDDVPNVEVGVELEGSLAAPGPRRRVRAARGPRRHDGRPRRAVARRHRRGARRGARLVRGQRPRTHRRPLGGLRPLARRPGPVRDRRLLAADAVTR